MILVLGDLTGYRIVPGFISAALLGGVSFRVKKKFKKFKKKYMVVSKTIFRGAMLE